MKIFRVLLPFTIVFLFLTACQKEVFKENKPPVVDAGKDTTIQLINAQDDIISLSGSATDADGQVVAYIWSQISGPNTANILYPGSVTTKVSGVISGQYVFQLMATDEKGAIGVKTVSITIKAPKVQTLVLQPARNPNETFTYSYDPTAPGVGDTQLPIGSWTVGGTPMSYRTYLKIDFSIPASATIISAKLTLYAMPNPHGGNSVDAHFGSANAFYIRRITSAWAPESTNWNRQPSTTTTNQLIIPNSTSSMQDATDIDVTNLVKDMQQNGNYGFAMRLETENYYNIRQYVSSYNSNASKHPKLVIQYSN